jgi:hypothetical protein
LAAGFSDDSLATAMERLVVPTTNVGESTAYGLATIFPEWQ